jgi:hypothetical protein
MRALLTYCRIILVLLPIFTLAWTIGRYGPVSDDWAMIQRATTGTFWNIDTTRPLAFLTPTLSYQLAGGNLNGMYAQIVLLHALEALLCFELLRRIMRYVIPDAAVFWALIGAGIYVLYPSDVSRYTIMMIHGRYYQLAVMAIMWCWVRFGETENHRWMLPAIGLTLLSLFTKESALLVYGLCPAIVWYVGRSPFGRRFWPAVIGWYGVLGAYSVWRFIGLSVDAAERTTRSLMLPPDLFGGIFGTLQQMTVGSIAITTIEHREWLSLGAPIGALPWITAIVIAIAIGVVWRNTPSLTMIDRRRGGMLIAAGLMIFIAGVLPHLFRGFPMLFIGNVDSRDTQIPIFGVVLMLIALPLFWRRGAMIVATVIAVVLISTGVVRQVQVGADFISAWEMQRVQWQRLFAIPSLSVDTPGTLILIHNSQQKYRNALLTSSGWGFRFGMRYLTGVQTSILPTFQIEPIRVEGDQVIINGRGIDRERVRLIDYDRTRTGKMNPLTYVPPELSAHPEQPIPLYTGDNQIGAPIPLIERGAALIDPPIMMSPCQTVLPVFSEDRATSDGDALIVQADTRVILDRRRVMAGESLHYNALLDCGIWVRVYFVSDTADRVFLPSQYGATIDYGTANESESPSYHTAFERGVID